MLLLNVAMEHSSPQSFLASGSWEWKWLREPGGARSSQELCGMSRKCSLGQASWKRIWGGVGTLFLESCLWGNALASDGGGEWRQGACFEHSSLQDTRCFWAETCLLAWIWVCFGLRFRNKTYFWLSNALSMLLAGDTVFLSKVKLALVSTVYFYRTLTASLHVWPNLFKQSIFKQPLSTLFEQNNSIRKGFKHNQ